MTEDIKLSLKSLRIDFFIIRTLEDAGMKANRSLMNKGFKALVKWENNKTLLSKQHYFDLRKKYIKEFLRAIEVLRKKFPFHASLLTHYRIQLEGAKDPDEIEKLYIEIKKLLESDERKM